MPVLARISDGADMAQWREQARRLWAAGIAPEHVQWRIEEAHGLFDAADAPEPTIDHGSRAALRVPREFLALADRVLAHRDSSRHARLYRMLWRLGHGERALLELITDADTAWAMACAKAVRRDMHKMKAFVRFREVVLPGGSVFVAWFEPEHDILSRVAPFFVRRFAGMHWSILTPVRSAHWDGQDLRLAAGAQRSDAPADDALEALWRTYYASIFNPARLKVEAMRSEMPVKYWKNLPEARLIPGLIRDALPRVQAMVARQPSLPRLRIPAPTLAAPHGNDPADLPRALRQCRACPLWEPATQAVPGEGPVDAQVVLLGEQPGDREDLAGRPFLGPAGQLLDQALESVGLDRRRFFVTNTVKHFKFEPRGKRRLHRAANLAEQAACRLWLEAELAMLRPRIVVCLGAMAARALLGPGFGLLRHQGQWQTLSNGLRVLPTVHPAYLLRLPAARRDDAYRQFVEDLRQLSTPPTPGLGG